MKISSKLSGRGFTLVELLVVIAMIAVLATISITAVFKFRTSADRVIAIGNLRQIQIANVNFATDNNGRFVPPQTTVDGENYGWFENPEFVSQLKSEEATYNTSGEPDTSLPISLMDPKVTKEKPANYKSLAASYGYTRPSSEAPLIISRLANPARSAAFITADSDGFVDHATKSRIAYRHDDKALVVYYDGRASTVTRSDIEKIDGKGGSTNIFWEAVQ